MAIADIIRQRKQQRTGAMSAQQLAERQYTAATGTAVGPRTGPAISNIGAQLSAAQGQAQQAGMTQQFDLQRQALRQQEQQQTQAFGQQQSAMQTQFEQQQQDLAAQQRMQSQQLQARDEMTRDQLTQREALATNELNNRYAEALAELASQRGIVENNVFQELGQAREEMGYARYAAAADQLGHVMAMSDQKYVDMIRRVGQINNLQDEIAFRKEATELAFGYDMEILSQQFDMQELINADARDAKRMLKRMDINMAMQLAAQAAKEEAYKNMIMGGVGVATGVMGQYSTPTPTGTVQQNTLTGPGGTAYDTGTYYQPTNSSQMGYV